jgi:hypothetical protein
MYLRDPSGNRLELFNSDYVRDLDRPPLKWTLSDFGEQGHSWWGYQAPPSFADAFPLHQEGWLAAVSAAA